MVRRGRGEIGKTGPTATNTPSPSPHGEDPTAQQQPKQEQLNSKNQHSATTPADPVRPLCESGNGGKEAIQASEILLGMDRDRSLPSAGPRRDGQDDGGSGGSRGGGGDDDDEAAIAAFEAALALCAEEGSSDAPLAALRELFAAAAGRAKEATDGREAEEDACNAVAAENLAVARELDANRTVASGAQATKHKYEVLCREEADLNRKLKEKLQAAERAEYKSAADLVEKFETVTPTVKEKLEAEEHRRRAQREGNESLRAKLNEFEKQTIATEETYAARLKPGSLEVQILEAQCNQQEAERRAHDARCASLNSRLEAAREVHAKTKKDTTERERYLSRIQAAWNGQKKHAAKLEAEVKELRAAKEAMSQEIPKLREAVKAYEAVSSLQKMTGRLQGLCDQLEPQVGAKRRELDALRGGTISTGEVSP